MNELLQSAFAALVGAVMSVFGLYHTLRQWPQPTIWQHVATAMPQIITVMIFLLCVVCVVVGILMLVRGIQRARFRFAQLQHVRFQHRGRYMDPDDPYQ